jgi:molecular chaperone DnaJ
MLSEEKFKDIQKAYAVLSDKQKRAAYDQFGHAGVDGINGWCGRGHAGFSDVFEDIFENIFSGGRGARQQQSRGQHGADLAIQCAINTRRSGLW